MTISPRARVGANTFLTYSVKLTIHGTINHPTRDDPIVTQRRDKGHGFQPPPVLVLIYVSSAAARMTRAQSTGPEMRSTADRVIPENLHCLASSQASALCIYAVAGSGREVAQSMKERSGYAPGVRSAALFLAPQRSNRCQMIDPFAGDIIRRRSAHRCSYPLHGDTWQQRFFNM
ncbi:hypothetical protein [Bradyrhizobium genosp. SA-3]|uniref:hypothetical protein n=1 Tax=Bradyrhizobium genosp. SA-3 TaxID=508868 RepID=UPI0013EE5451|nr:hypothetical protein [Bradyrhizobium genosp. SA-3]